MTHMLTHTGKGLYGNNGAKSAADLILLEQKWPESVGNQGLEGSQPVGKDEVGGSNPPSSSRKHLKSSDFGCFLLQKMSFWNAKKIVTHTATHTPNKLYPIKWTQENDPRPRFVDTHLTHRVK